MLQILIGSLVLSLIHAVIPNHWIPLIAVSKTEKWTVRETLSATFITGFAHTLSTIVIGVAVGFIGVSLSEYYDYIIRFAAPAILTIIGTVYIITDLIRNGHSHGHSHDHIKAGKKTSSKRALLFSLSLAMFLTPCIEIEAYYFQATVIGWVGILIVSLVYLLTTVIVMLILVYLGIKGVQNLRSHYLEHHEKLVTGIVLLILGIISFVFEM